MNHDVTTGDLCRLLGITRETLSKLAKRIIIERGSGRGRWLLEPSCSSYCAHLREISAGRGGDTGADVRARLGAAQAQLSETKAKQLAGELVEVEAVESYWRGKLRSFRNRVLAIPNRLRDLSARQSVTLTQELRAALTELADRA